MHSKLGAVSEAAGGMQQEAQRKVWSDQRAVAEREAWGGAQDELVDEISDALQCLSDELDEVAAEQDPLIRLQGLVRCKDQQMKLAVVAKQITEEAAEHAGSRGGAEATEEFDEALNAVNARTGQLVADELQLLREAIQSLEMNLRDNLDKLNAFFLAQSSDRATPFIEEKLRALL